MKIQDVICAVGMSGFLYKDLAAIKAGAVPDGDLLYRGKPVTEGFTQIIQPGAIVSVMLVLEDGSVAFGDCADVILVGTAGRDRMFLPEEHLPILQGKVADRLRGRDLGDFRAIAEEFDGLSIDGKKLHTAVRYGVTQALLDAVALARRETIAETVCREYATTMADRPVPILVGTSRTIPSQLDRVILKGAEILPHTAFLTVDDHLGVKGEKLLAYMEFLTARIRAVGAPGYKPKLHVDVYGTLGEAFADDAEAIADYIGRLEKISGDLPLMVESPVIAASRQGQIELFLAINKALKSKGIKAQIVADEWCNTLDDIKAFGEARATELIQIKTPDLGGINNSIEAVIYCKRHGIGANLGGTSNETDQSARITAQIGLACQADSMSNKPGQGADEGWMIMVNEMTRTLARVEARRKAGIGVVRSSHGAA